MGPLPSTEAAQAGQYFRFLAALQVNYSSAGIDMNWLRERVEIDSERGVWILREHNIVQFLHMHSSVVGLREFVLGFFGGELSDVE